MNNDYLSIMDAQQLMELKEQIKNQIKEHMTWQERMELYKHVQEINQRIQSLNVQI